MAVKFGMTVAQIIGQLTRGFMKAMGRKPDGLEKIKIQQEAVQRFKEMNKVVDMEGNVIDTSKGIMGGKQVGQKGIFDNIFNRMQSQMGKNIKEVKTKNRPDVYGLDDYDISNMSSIKKEIIKTEQKLGNLNPESKGFREKAKELVDKIESLKNKMRDDKAMGGRIGYKDGPKLSDFIDIQAEGSKSGERQIPGAPPGITMDTQTYNFIVNAELPASEKINILLEYGRNKIRDKIAKDGKELFVGEGGVRNRGIGFNFNPEDAGFGGEVMFNPDTNDARGVLTYKFNEGGRAGLKDGMNTGMFEKLFFNKNAPILSGLNTTALFDLVVAAQQAAGPLLGLAEGGRIGYKDGPDRPDRRKFMKIAGGILGAIPFVGTKILSKAAPAVSKAVDISGPALAKIVETVMSLGKTLSMKGRKLKELTTKKKYKDIEVEEDMLDGPSYTIKKGNKEIYYKPGRMDETGGIEDDIIEVIEDRVKKAGGGLARMLGE